MDHDRGDKTMDAKSPDAVFAEQLASARERRGISQRDFARKVTTEEKALVSRATIARTEAAQREVTLAEVIAFAAVLNVSPSALILPLNGSEPVALTPARTVTARVARRWIRGQVPLPGADVRAFADLVADEDRRAMEDVSLRFILDRVEELVAATVDEDRDAAADAVDKINDELQRMRAALERNR
jgi:transcriptional regulator with XRE-family HTH domain